MTLTVMPPADLGLNTTVIRRVHTLAGYQPSEEIQPMYAPSGGDVFSRIPTASNSASNNFRCSFDLVASTEHARSVNCQRSSLDATLMTMLTHDDNHVRSLGDTDDLSTTSSTHRSALDDTGQIEQLYPSSFVLQYSRNCLE